MCGINCVLVGVGPFINLQFKPGATRDQTDYSNDGVCDEAATFAKVQ